MLRQKGVVLILTLMIVFLTTLMSVGIIQLIHVQLQMHNAATLSEQLLTKVIQAAQLIEEDILNNRFPLKDTGQSIQDITDDVRLSYDWQIIPSSPCIKIAVISQNGKQLREQDVDFYRLTLHASNPHFQQKHVQVVFSVPAKKLKICDGTTRYVNLGRQSWLELDKH